MSTTDESFKEGLEAYLAEDFIAAEAAFLRCLEEEPDSSEVLLNLGNTYFKLDNLPRAEELWRKAIHLNPLEDKGYLNLGNLFYSQNDYDKAIDYWERCIKLRDEHADAYLNLGLAYEALSRMHEAHKYYHQFLARAAGLPPIRLRRRIEEAHQVAEQNYRLAEKYMRAGILSKAKEAFKACCAQYPLPPKMYQHYATVLYQLQEYPDAALWFEAAYEMLEDEATILINLGVVYEKLDDPFRALWAYGLALGRDPQSNASKIRQRYDALWSQSGVSLLRTRIEEVKSLISSADYRKAERLARYCRDVASCSNSKEPLAEIDEIVNALEERKDPKKQVAMKFYSLAEEARASGRYEEALAHYERYLELLPDGDKAEEVVGMKEQMANMASGAVSGLLSTDQDVSQNVA